MATYLDRILAAHRAAAARDRRDLDDLRARAAASGPGRGFRAALSARTEIAVIAEIKRASPSKGMLAPDLDATRTATEVYDHEMSEGGHRELLDVLLACQSKVILSGYANDLYDEVLARWTREEFNLPNNAAGGKKKGRETEVLWCNF